MRAFVEKGKLHLVTRNYFKGIWVEIPEELIVFTKAQTKAIRQAIADEIIKEMKIELYSPANQCQASWRESKK